MWCWTGRTWPMRPCAESRPLDDCTREYNNQERWQGEIQKSMFRIAKIGEAIRRHGWIFNIFAKMNLFYAAEIKVNSRKLDHVIWLCQLSSQKVSAEPILALLQLSGQRCIIYLEILLNVNKIYLSFMIYLWNYWVKSKTAFKFLITSWKAEQPFLVNSIIFNYTTSPSL